MTSNGQVAVRRGWPHLPREHRAQGVAFFGLVHDIAEFLHLSSTQHILREYLNYTFSLAIPRRVQSRNL